MKKTIASLLLSALALSTLVVGAAPGAAQSPAPPITVQGAPADGDWSNAPANGAESSAPAAATPPAAAPPAAPPAKKKSAEILPWTDKPLVTVTGDLAAMEAAAAQCSGLFEAACRDLKTCAWVADMALEDGTEVPARCAARPPAPPKKAAKKATPAKVTAKAPEATEAPAVKAAVTRVEDEASKAKPEPEPEKKKAAAIEIPDPPKEPKVPEIAKPKAPEAPAQAYVGVSPEEKQAAKAPIVVKPPPTNAAPSQMPSFGSMGGFNTGGNAVVVTVPPPSP